MDVDTSAVVDPVALAVVAPAAPAVAPPAAPAVPSSETPQAPQESPSAPIKTEAPQEGKPEISAAPLVPPTPPPESTPGTTAAQQDSPAISSTPYRAGSITLAALAVQCASCLKWRTVPLLEDYENIRARHSVTPFVCEQASKWKSGASCQEEPDIAQDGTMLWAMDKPDIPQPPAGWKRRIVVRGETSKKFSDVYYYSPCGKTMRSTNDVERFLAKNEPYVRQGITVQQFSFASPRPFTKRAADSKQAAGTSAAIATPEKASAPADASTANAAPAGAAAPSPSPPATTKRPLEVTPETPVQS